MRPHLSLGQLEPVVELLGVELEAFQESGGPGYDQQQLSNQPRQRVNGGWGLGIEIGSFHFDLD